MPATDDKPFGAFAPDDRRMKLIGWTRAMPEGWLGRRLAFTIRRRALKGITEPVDVESLGAHFRLYPSDNVSEKRILCTPQYFDPIERSILIEHGRAKGPGFTFVDIGANVGGYALHVAANVPGARVIAVEPQPVIFERLCRNIALNPGVIVKAIACAVADQDGEVTLFIDRDNRGETGLRFVRPEHRGEGEVTVPCKTLLTLCREEGLTAIDAIKLDVEGAEDLILDPFYRHAPHGLWPRLIVIEDGQARWQTDLTKLLESRGYRLRTKTRMNLVYELA